MPQATTGNNIRLGLFVAAGLGCLLAILFLLGRRQSVFSQKIVVRADFRNVSGLIPGNNVRLGGITVGIIKKIRIINDTTVRVEMSLDRDVRPFVHRNTIAAIGTDGLVGNTIVNLTAARGAAAGASPLVSPGDILPTRNPVGIDAMLGTLDVSNKNLVAITRDLRLITGRLSEENAFWKLLDDEQLAQNVRKSMQNTAAAAGQLNQAAHDVQLLTHGVRAGGGPAGYLFTDTAFAGRFGHAAQQLAGTSDTLAATLAVLKRQVQTVDGPLHTLLTDTALSRQLRQSATNVAQGTASFHQNMDALQHNFLLRGYFRRQAKKQARAAGM